MTCAFPRKYIWCAVFEVAVDLTSCTYRLFDSKQRHCSDCEPIARKARAQSEDRDSSGLPPSSAKIRMMMKLLKSTDTRSGGKEKTIIFSQVGAC